MIRRATALATALVLAGSLTAAVDAAPRPAYTSTTQHIAFTKWSSTSAFASGTLQGTSPGNDRLSIASPIGTQDHTDPFGDGTAKAYDYARWISPVVDPGFNLDELVASWNAKTPPGTWIEVDMRGTTDTGVESKWYIMGRWDENDPNAGGAIFRTSVPRQGDQYGYVSVDTFFALSGHSLSNWQLRVTLNRLHGTQATPTVSLAGAFASNLDIPNKVPASPLGGAEGITLDVPTYSQMIHEGQYPQWDGGGEAWCSPTSTSMVVAYWGRGPTPQDYSWVDPSYADPWVDYAARNTYDYSYAGAGNWPFNAAYAGRYGLQGYVTQLRSLTEAEQFIKAGIPLVVSVAFKSGQLKGAGYSTSGHLMVIVGFDKNGNVVVNDPAAHLSGGDDQVRFTYNREQFENVWITQSGGVAYIIHPSDVSTPPPPPEANW
ncbi:MAG: C39 family peptidase [Nocardioidaceae bacterium]